MGRIGNLITDGNFASETQRGYQGNTWQEHVTGAMLFGSGVGMAWSSYRYDREWLGKKEWLRPALRAGRLLNSPECVRVQRIWPEYGEVCYNWSATGSQNWVLEV